MSCVRDRHTAVAVILPCLGCSCCGHGARCSGRGVDVLGVTVDGLDSLHEVEAFPRVSASRGLSP